MDDTVTDDRPQLSFGDDDHRISVGTYEAFVRFDYDNMTMLISPKQARKLAQVLVKCADKAERSCQ